MKLPRELRLDIERIAEAAGATVAYETTGNFRTSRHVHLSRSEPVRHRIGHVPNR